MRPIQIQTLSAGVQLGQLTTADFLQLINPPGSPLETMVAREIRRVYAQVVASEISQPL